jgi:multidrug efflux pump subunit AcrA (membrane-fusion protein)
MNQSAQVAPAIDEPHVTDDQYQKLATFAEQRRGGDRVSQLIVEPGLLLKRSLAYILAALVAFALLISFVAHINVVVTAKGVISPESDNIPIQSQEEGTVVEVHARPGDRVAQGQPLLTLRYSLAGMNLASTHRELTVEETSFQRLAKAREVVAAVVRDPASVSAAAPPSMADAGAQGVTLINNLRASAKDLDTAHRDERDDLPRLRREMQAEIALLGGKVSQLQSTLDLAVVERKGREDDLARRRQEAAHSEDLLERHMLTRSQMAMEREQVMVAESALNAHKARMGELEIEISNSRLRASELQGRIRRLETDTRNRVEQATMRYQEARASLESHLAAIDQELGRVQAALNNIKGRQELLESQIQNLRIESPAAGTLTELKAAALGTVVGRGMVVATVVPSDKRAIIVAKLANRDAGFVVPGLVAKAKMEAFPFHQFGTVPATVRAAFADPSSSDGEFIVRLALERPTIDIYGHPVALQPGMTAAVDIITRKRTIFETIIGKVREKAAAVMPGS